VSATSTYIQAGLPGGLAGTFTLEVNLPTVGDSIVAVNGSNTFMYLVSVESVLPTNGSIYGGTLLTITGQNFATDPQQTLVFIGITVNWMCSIESMTATTILCRTPAINEDYSVGDAQQIVVTTRLIVQSACLGGCNFTYLSESSSPNITNLTVNGSEITLEGTNFLPVSNCSVSLTNTVTQAVKVVPTTNCTPTSAIFLISSDIISGKYTVKVRN
jgi:hypothetical protein